MNPIVQTFATTLVAALLIDFQTFAAAQKEDPGAKFRWKPFITKIVIALCVATLGALGAPIPQG
ncbi:MAG: hypothetical protein EBR82_42085 [Caulobacteraceae bacterium]|nr:hypothetical protein [Caulobacteraceae bacterium]NDG19700.1 hypothetical protein [Betaproteobacteria bacterium]